jgi:hypothetical protein
LHHSTARKAALAKALREMRTNLQDKYDNPIEKVAWRRTDLSQV